MNFHAMVKTIITLVGIAFLFAGISAFASPNLSADDEEFTLSGLVLDAESNEPIAGVLVSMVGHQENIETDSDGLFSFANVSEGEHTLVFQASGYEYTELELYVTEDQAEIKVFLNKSEK